ncbi:MAG TPA: AarF/UbiB family protein [Mycobacteriales bacterium]|nr:AarF/UbiB family protein [Mycobacteriales bacterium]
MDLLAYPLVAVFTAGTVLLLAVAVRRLLGLRFGIVRTLLAGILAFVVTGPLFAAMRSGTDRDASGTGPFWLLVLAIALALLAAMVFLVLAEVLVPAGTVPPPYEWVRLVRARVARTRRYGRIVRIALRHGLGRALRGRADPTRRQELARSLTAALDEGGVTFVKLGQVLSTRRDLLPPEFVTELGRLQDRAAAAPWAEVEATLVAELGRPVAEVFAAVSPEPLAAASVAQVHTATLLTGQEVVLKIQRPGIGPVVERDLDIVHRLARTLASTTTWGRSMGVRELADGFAVALREELDFRVEAANMAAVGSAGGDVVVPVPHRELSTARLLVMQRLDGVPLAAAGPLIAERGLDRHALARTLLGTLLRQVVLDGVFHADPHPGNVLLLTDGRLALLDFGSVGRLDVTVRGALQQLLLAVDRGDPVAVSDALLEVVPRPDEIDAAALERAVGVVLARHLGPGSVPGMRMFADLVRIVAGFGLAVPPAVAAVFRALATGEGTLTQLAPGFDVVAEARRFATAQLAERWRTASPRQLATDELVTLLPMLRRVPRRVDRILAAAEGGRLAVNVRLFADERDRRYATGMLQQLLLTVLGATAGLMAVLLLGTSGGPDVSPDVGLYQLIGYFLLIISSVLVLRVLVLIFRRDP